MYHLIGFCLGWIQHQGITKFKHITAHLETGKGTLLLIYVGIYIEV